MSKLILRILAVSIVCGLLIVGFAVGARQILATVASVKSPSFRAATCPPVAPVTVGTVTVPAGPVAGFCQDRLVNAAHIITAARTLGIGKHTQTIGVMTAIGESGLRNLNYGDAAGHDSRGLFQQRANGAWGSLTDRMTPTIAAHNFFLKLVSIPDWKTLGPTQAAHAVQANADPTYYTQYWSAAEAIVAALNP